MVANNWNPGQRGAGESIVRLAESGKQGMLSRRALLQTFHAFAPVETPPRGSEASQLRDGPRPKPSAEDAASECLHELFTTLCRLAHCPNVVGVEVGHFKANVSLNFASGPTRYGDGVILEMFILHDHVEGGRTSRDWRETRICAYLQGYVACGDPKLCLMGG